MTDGVNLKLDHWGKEMTFKLDIDPKSHYAEGGARGF